MTQPIEFKTQWNLELLYSNNDEFENDVKYAFKKTANYFKKYLKVNFKKASTKEILKYLKDSEEVNTIIEKPFFYIQSKNSLDTQNQDIIKREQSLYNEYNDLFSDKSNDLSNNFEKIGYERLIKLAHKKSLANYKNQLINTANSIKYKLENNVEKAVDKLSNVIGISNDLFNEYSNSFSYIVDGKIYNKSEVYSKLESSDNETRLKFLNAIYEKYNEKEKKIIFGNLYTMVCKTNAVDMKLRGITNVMESRNISEEMDNEVVDILIDKVKEQYPIFHKYLNLKAKYLKKDILDAHDTIAPVKLTDSEEIEIPFEKGMDMYLKIIRDFDEEFYNHSKSMAIDGRLDVHTSDVKRDGAYSANLTGNGNFILLNYMNNFGAVTTLAHEYGHALHAYYSDRQTASNADHSLCLAETASIFNETLVKEYIIENEITDNTSKLEFIFDYLDSIFSTIFRQIAYTSFERNAHNAAYNNEALSYDDYDKLYQNELDEMFGNNLKDSYKWNSTWQRVPHLYNTPFYCYSYAFGNILAFNLYNKYKTMDKQEFKKIYLNILSAGCSKNPYELLLENGIDIKDDSFYTTAFNVIEKYINIIENSELNN